MKFQFKIQPYQTDAVHSVVNIFAGQPFAERIGYTRDLGIKRPPQPTQINFLNPQEIEEEVEVGFKNPPIALTDSELLESIRGMQTCNNIKQSPSLVKHLGRCSLDVEMETGTGKTYVYIKTIFELNKLYGWSKYIIVVPSIAIREGVKKSFEITQEHFMEHYGKKARFFIYNSKNLTDLDNFSASAGINVMIINIQAFNARGADNRRIYDRLDDFGSRRPIDVIKANNPILIMDEPQKMGGDATQESLNNFNPLFCLNYSATHAKNHNLVYVLDALDAYNKRLVKKIEVKGFDIKNFRGTDQYLFLEDIQVSPKKPPVARMELEINYNKSINRELRNLNVDDDLYALSNNMEQYRGYRVSEIDPLRNTVTFTNGVVLERGVIVGDVSEKDMRRIQIRETIISHFEKEQRLFEQGIKTLSLFFIDEVAKYRKYDDGGNEIASEYSLLFEREYIDILNRYITLEETPYVKYLKGIGASRTHTGYFSIDKKGRMVNSETKRGSDESDDVSAYDLILKNKERLLSFEEPVRFIFSHSALREGWDNPNVFQICTLKHSDSSTQKRQEVGRGLRLAVNQHGDRMDDPASVHDINVLTVVASESYGDFVKGLQKDMSESLSERPRVADKAYFTGKVLNTPTGTITVSEDQADGIVYYLIQNAYVDRKHNITEQYHQAKKDGTLAALPDDLLPHAEPVFLLIDSVFSDSRLPPPENDRRPKNNPLNDKFYRTEFQQLWNRINHKATYRVDFDTAELIRNAVTELDKNLRVTPLQYTIQRGEQRAAVTAEDLQQREAFTLKETVTERNRYSVHSGVRYDLIGKLAETTGLTRRTVLAILQGIHADTFMQFRSNPEHFISEASRLINEQKATVIIEHLAYDTLEERFDPGIFTAGEFRQDFSRAGNKLERHIYDYVITDSDNERDFVTVLDTCKEVVVYAKLPRGFLIPTPVGNYNPDWAIAFREGSVKHIYFVAETKGGLSSLQIRGIERCKIECARKFFAALNAKYSPENVTYQVVDSFERLMAVVK